MRTRESGEGHPGPASGSDKEGQLEGLTVNSLLKGAEAREGRKTSLIGDVNLFVLLLPYSPKELSCAKTELESREERMYDKSMKSPKRSGLKGTHKFLLNN